MYKSFIRRKLAHVVNTFSTRYAYIQYVPGHKNSDGDSAPYVIKSHKNNKILSSHKTRDDAKKHLIDIKVHASFGAGVFLPEKNKEIIVHLRMQKGLDKDQLVTYMKDRFNLIDQDAERMFYEAFPDGVDLQEEDSLDSLENILVGVGGVPVELIEDTFNSLLGGNKLSPANVDPLIKDNIKIVVSSLLRRRGFV